MQLQQLNLNENQTKTVGQEGRNTFRAFWKRQFQSESNSSQRVFDKIFGIILPVIYFLFDPMFFRGWNLYSEAEFAKYKPFTYILSYVSIMALLAFMLWGARLKWLNAFLCGLFAVAACISFGIGLVLVPFSLIGLIILIGVLGFTPLLTAFVFWRNAVRAYKFAKPEINAKLLFHSAALAAILSLSLPILINRKIETGLQTMRNSDEQTIRATARRLQFVAPLIDVNRLNGADCGGRDGLRHDALVDAYQNLSGKSLNNIDYRLCGDF